MKADFSVTIPSKTCLWLSCGSVTPQGTEKFREKQRPQAAPRPPPSDHQSISSGQHKAGCWRGVFPPVPKWPVGSQKDDFIYMPKTPVTLRKLFDVLLLNIQSPRPVLLSLGEGGVLLVESTCLLPRAQPHTLSSS